MKINDLLASWLIWSESKKFTFFQEKGKEEKKVNRWCATKKRLKVNNDGYEIKVIIIIIERNEFLIFHWNNNNKPSLHQKGIVLIFTFFKKNVKFKCFQVFENSQVFGKKFNDGVIYHSHLRKLMIGHDDGNRWLI